MINKITKTLLLSSDQPESTQKANTPNIANIIPTFESLFHEAVEQWILNEKERRTKNSESEEEEPNINENEVINIVYWHDIISKRNPNTKPEKIAPYWKLFKAVELVTGKGLVKANQPNSNLLIETDDYRPMYYNGYFWSYLKNIEKTIATVVNSPVIEIIREDEFKFYKDADEKPLTKTFLRKLPPIQRNFNQIKIAFKDVTFNVLTQQKEPHDYRNYLPSFAPFTYKEISEHSPITNDLLKHEFWELTQDSDTKELASLIGSMFDIGYKPLFDDQDQLDAFVDQDDPKNREKPSHFPNFRNWAEHIVHSLTGTKSTSHQNLIMIGDTNSGKSTLMKLFAEKIIPYSCSINHWHRWYSKEEKTRGDEFTLGAGKALKIEDDLEINKPIATAESKKGTRALKRHIRALYKQSVTVDDFYHWIILMNYNHPIKEKGEEGQAILERFLAIEINPKRTENVDTGLFHRISENQAGLSKFYRFVVRVGFSRFLDTKNPKHTTISYTNNPQSIDVLNNIIHNKANEFFIAIGLELMPKDYPHNHPNKWKRIKLKSLLKIYQIWYQYEEQKGDLPYQIDTFRTYVRSYLGAEAICKKPEKDQPRGKPTTGLLNVVIKNEAYLRDLLTTHQTHCIPQGLSIHDFF